MSNEAQDTSEKKKRTPKTIKPKSKFVMFLRSAQFRKLRGVCYMLFAVFLCLAILSFVATGGKQNNIMGALGWLSAKILTNRLFGIASIGVAAIIFLYGFYLLSRKNALSWHLVCILAFWMVWISTSIGYVCIMLPSGSNASEYLQHYAGIGATLAALLHHLLNWGAVVLLLFIAFVFLKFVHHVDFKTPKVNIKLSEKLKNIKWLSKKGGTETVTKQPAQPDTTKTPDQSEPDGITFSIDDEFERVNSKARGENDEPPKTEITDSTDEIELTINDTQNSTPTTPSDEQPQEESEPIEDSDDYARHFEKGDLYDPQLELKLYEMPSTDILTLWENNNVKVEREELIANKDRIVKTLRDYNIEIVEISASPGPTVTLYEIKPAPGVRISKIKGLEDDIALSLSALGIRIIAPIPGKGTIGIEVPNAKPQVVSMKTMLESSAFKDNKKMELPIALGKTISNETYVTDLAKMPHLLMAGATGTGKSVGLNAVIASLLYKKHPSELKFVMVDPKKVELSLYSKIERHYLAKLPDSEEPVITDTKKVVQTLNSLCIEMDQRYDLLKQAQVRKITEYNDKYIHRHLNPNNGHRYLPYIVLVIDEFADLIMTAGKEVEQPICRLAQLARAVGIHLIIATQRPTTNIITGTIKANFPARIAFKVTSAIDSRTILDTGGAQRLIGRGDMLISLSGSDLVRLQCALIETNEIEEVVAHIANQRGYPDGYLLPEYLDENDAPNKDIDLKQRDECFEDAARLVYSSGFGSTSLLQRKLQLGFARAGRIIDQLEAAGIVGPPNGSKPRDLLVRDEESLNEILRNL